MEEETSRPMMSRLRLIASDFFVSFFWVWSGSLLRNLAFRFLGSGNNPVLLLIKASVAVPYLVFFTWLGRATKGGSYNPLIVLCYAISGNFAVFLFSVIGRIPAQVIGSVAGVWLTNLTIPGAFHGPSLSVDIHRGTFTEGFLTFIIVIIVLTLKKKDLGSSAKRIWISSVSKVVLHLLGSDITGGIMNPATAFGWAFAQGTHGSKEHICVYWLAPIEATLLGCCFHSFSGRFLAWNALSLIKMGLVGEELDIDFVISAGDNFYESGLRDVDDKSFEESFTKIYTAKSLQKQWYSVLGNHDYRGNVLAQLDSILTKIDSRWLCLRSFMVDAEIAHFFFLDTTPFVKKYWKHPKKSHYDWRGVAPRKKYISRLLKDLETALGESTATWKIVVGHHTLRSVSEHGETPELVNLLLPMLINYGVDIYINGHDHCLQHISSADSFIHFLTSGGGSKAWRGIIVPTMENLQFFYDGQGFVSLQLSADDAKIKFYDVFGGVLHEWRIMKQSYDYFV